MARLTSQERKDIEGAIRRLEGSREFKDPLSEARFRIKALKWRLTQDQEGRARDERKGRWKK